VEFGKRYTTMGELMAKDRAVTSRSYNVKAEIHYVYDASSGHWPQRKGAHYVDAI